MKICDSYLYTAYPTYITNDDSYTKYAFKLDYACKVISTKSQFTVSGIAACTSYFYIGSYNKLRFNNYRACPILELNHYIDDLVAWIEFDDYSGQLYDKSVLYTKYRLRFCDYIANCYIDIETSRYVSIGERVYSKIYSSKSVSDPWTRVDCISAYASICICDLDGTERGPLCMYVYNIDASEPTVPVGNITICSLGNICASNS